MIDPYKPSVRKLLDKAAEYERNKSYYSTDAWQDLCRNKADALHLAATLVANTDDSDAARYDRYMIVPGVSEHPDKRSIPGTVKIDGTDYPVGPVRSLPPRVMIGDYTRDWEENPMKDTIAQVEQDILEENTRHLQKLEELRKKRKSLSDGVTHLKQDIHYAVTIKADQGGPKKTITMTQKRGDYDAVVTIERAHLHAFAEAIWKAYHALD